eukprot:967903_1
MATATDDACVRIAPFSGHFCQLPSPPYGHICSSCSLLTAYSANNPLYCALDRRVLYTNKQYVCTVSNSAKHRAYSQERADTDTFDREDAFMFGDALFVAPIVTKDTEEVSVVLPQKEHGVYYELRSIKDDEFMVNVFAMNEGKERVIRLVNYKFETPVLRVGGRMTVEKHKYIRKSSALMANDPITIIVALDTNYCAESQYYLDDGETLNHLESDQYLLSQFTFDATVFENKIVHANPAVNTCNIYQIWILMPDANRIGLQSVTVNSKQSETANKLDQCFYKTPRLLVLDNVDIAVNFDFKIEFE